MAANSRAGAGPRRMMWTWRLRRLAGGLLVVVGCVLAIEQLVDPGAWVLTIVVGAGLWLRAGGRIRRARSGERGEREVARALGRWAIASYGWRPPGRRSDVDVVVAWPTIAAIEVKRATGRVRARRDGSVFAGGVRLPGDPLRQATGNAAAVRAHLDLEEPVEAVLCVTGMEQRPRWVEVDGNPVAVCSTKHLRRTLRRLPRSDRMEALELLAGLEMAD